MAKTSGYGAIFKVTISSVLTAIANVKEIGFPDQMAETADVTTHDSASGYAEWIKTGLLRLGAFDLTLVWDPAAVTHIALLAALASTTPLVMTLTPRSLGEVISFSGFITKVARTSSTTGAYEAVVSVQPTGIPTITP